MIDEQPADRSREAHNELQLYKDAYYGRKDRHMREKSSLSFRLSFTEADLEDLKAIYPDWEERLKKFRDDRFEKECRENERR